MSNSNLNMLQDAEDKKRNRGVQRCSPLTTSEVLTEGMSMGGGIIMMVFWVIILAAFEPDFFFSQKNGLPARCDALHHST